MAEMVGYTNFTDQLDQLRRASGKGVRYWRAREIRRLLGYAGWDNFEAAIARARKACENAGFDPDNQFRATTKMVKTGSGARREVKDWYLTRYACYLVAMNSDSQKKEVAFAQTYFAVQTRRQELADQANGDETRLELREKVRIANRQLTGTAKGAGVTRFGLFFDEGYLGLYGMRYAAIKRRKGLAKKEHLLDRAGAIELAANQLKSLLAGQKITEDDIRGERGAFQAHFVAGREIREAIGRVNRTLPEDLPPERPIRELASRRQKRLPSPGPKMTI
jgi:DNA-damage-inducible protein D